MTRKLTRNGKLARLPKLQRDMVNLMLRNNTPHDKIVDALDEHGFRVTRRNVSNWKTRGGYREWCDEQDRALARRLAQDNLVDSLRTQDAGQLSEVGLQTAATHLSQFLLTPEAQKLITTNPQAYFRTVASLCRLNTQIHSAQKDRDDSARNLGYRHDPERVKREDETRVERTREIWTAESLGERPSDPIIPHRNYIPSDKFPCLPEPEPGPSLLSLLREMNNPAKPKSPP